MVTQIRWQNSDIASQALIDPLLDDKGDYDEHVRNAARKYAIRLLENEPGTYDMGDLDGAVTYFIDGYEQAEVDLGKRKPDNLNTFTG